MIRFRPHHFLCTLGFQGKGYSSAFVANYVEITQQLQLNPATPIQVVNQTDSICDPCPHKQGELCETQAKISQLDQAHAAALNIQPGDILTWAEAKQLIAAKISLEKFHTICATCNWKSLGVCEQALNDHIESFKLPPS
jgi:uncharacterized protein